MAILDGDVWPDQYRPERIKRDDVQQLLRRVKVRPHSLVPGVDEEVRRITDECYGEARRLLRENRSKLDAIVSQLLERESLDEPEIYAAAGIPRPASTPTPAPVPA